MLIFDFPFFFFFSRKINKRVSVNISPKIPLRLHNLCSYHRIENQTGYRIRLLSGKPLPQSCVIDDFVN